MTFKISVTMRNNALWEMKSRSLVCLETFPLKMEAEYCIETPVNVNLTNMPQISTK